MAQKIAFVDELETGGLDFGAQHAFLDPMQGLGYGDTVAGTMDDAASAGLRLREIRE